MSEIIASSSSGAIGLNSRVTLHFSLILDSGEEFDTTRGGDPATFTVGDTSFLPGFEKSLFGLKAGDEVQISLTADQAFGPRQDSKVQRLPKNRFRGMNIEPGLLVSFSSDGGELPGLVTGIFEDMVRIDFNHPLAGKNITFDVSIIAVGI